MSDDLKELDEHGFLKAYWIGEYGLIKSIIIFFGSGFIAPFIVLLAGLPFAVIYMMVLKSFFIIVPGFLAPIFVLISYVVWSVVGLWRSARNSGGIGGFLVRAIIFIISSIYIIWGVIFLVALLLRIMNLAS